MLVGIGREREKGFHFSRDFGPAAEVRPGFLAPGFGEKSDLNRVEQRQFSKPRQQVVAGIDPVDNAREFCEGARSGSFARAQVRCERSQARRGKTFALDAFEDMGKKLEPFRVAFQTCNGFLGAAVQPEEDDQLAQENAENGPGNTASEVVSNSGNRAKGNKSQRAPNRR